MASNLAFGNSLDVVAVFNSSFQQVFRAARPITATVRPSSRIMDHTIETGNIISDYKIILPTEIHFTVILPPPFARDLYEEIWNLWQSSEILTVQTKARNYINMIIVDPPHDEKPEMFDAFNMTIKFRQAQLVPAVSNFAPADPTQADTQNLGDQNSYSVSGVAGTDGDITFSSIPPQQPAYTLNGVQTLGGTSSLPAQQSPFSSTAPQVTGVQSTIPETVIGAGFR